MFAVVTLCGFLGLLPVGAGGPEEAVVPPSKRDLWVKDKVQRATVETASRVHSPAVRPVTTLYNVWTHEALPVHADQDSGPHLHQFLRDHVTKPATGMDGRLLNVLTAAARKFKATRIEVVSGYRSPKYNLMLRKKGREVARQSQHSEGRAVDFRIRGVPVKALLKFVRSLRLGGVGFYPHSQFVHADTGPIRFWKGS